MRIFNLIILIISFLPLNSCCTKKDCEEMIEGITLKNFTNQDADSIIIKSYQKNSNFSILSDSTFESGTLSSSYPDKLIIHFPHGFNYDLDYKIEVLSIGRAFSINGFEKKKDECNSCFPWGHTYFDLLDKYFVNGIEKHSDGNGIIIEK